MRVMPRFKQLQAGHPVTTSFDAVFQQQPRWLLDRPVKPGDDTHLEAVILRVLTHQRPID
jgi:hypothetical protein